MSTTWEESFAVRSIPLNASTFTDIVGASVPIDCNTAVILNLSTIDFLLRSDPGNVGSEVTIGAGQQFEIGGPRPRSGYRPARFKAGDPICSLRAASGTPSATMVYTK